MDCPILLVAEKGEISAKTGKLNLEGIFNDFNARKFPINIKGTPVIVRLVADPIEYNRTFTLKIELIDEDGHSLCTWSKKRTVPFLPNNRLVSIDQILGLPDCKISRPGSYQIVALVDGQIMASYPIEAFML
jgi:hypothetical protein